ncbi:MAG: hypothetical protein M5R36_24370 [Deltaproteobacteria bacterium]|nr:hypothetical protein [Deltaproteobacteria bacterium]
MIWRSTLSYSFFSASVFFLELQDVVTAAVLEGLGDLAGLGHAERRLVELGRLETLADRRQLAAFLRRAFVVRIFLRGFLEGNLARGDLVVDLLGVRLHFGFLVLGIAAAQTEQNMAHRHGFRRLIIVGIVLVFLPRLLVRKPPGVPP